jgi:hypothetical protein
VTAQPERWRPIPDPPDRYLLSDRERIWTCEQTIIRSNGVRYTVRGRLRRIAVHRPTGARYCKLSTGERGRYRTVYIASLMREIWPDVEAAS